VWFVASKKLSAKELSSLAHVWECEDPFGHLQNLEKDYTLLGLVGMENDI